MLCLLLRCNSMPMYSDGETLTGWASPAGGRNTRPTRVHIQHIRDLSRMGKYGQNQLFLTLVLPQQLSQMVPSSNTYRQKRRQIISYHGQHQRLIHISHRKFSPLRHCYCSAPQQVSILSKGKSCPGKQGLGFHFITIPTISALLYNPAAYLHLQSRALCLPDALG